MEAGLIQSFIREIGHQAQFGLIAAADIENAFKTRDINRVWYSIQNLLVAAANISKLLWPPNKASSSRGDTLRTLLNVKADSALSSRKARNHLEHFDERIGKWDISPQKHMVIDTNIGSIGNIQGGTSSIYVRNYDPSTKKLSIYDEEFELQPLIEAIEVLKSETDNRLK